MLDNYYFSSGSQTTKEKKRLIAVQAALEIAKAAVSATTANERSDSVEDALKYTASQLGPLADAIQAALETK